MGLPFLDCFLDSKGKALAATGRPLPTRFNTFFFGCGLTKQLWIPKTGGKDYEMTSQLKPLEAFRSKLNVFSGLRVPLDDNPNFQHWSGVAAAATGISPTKQSEFDSKTIDQQIADVISHGTRYKSVCGSGRRRSQAKLFQPGRRQHAAGRSLAAVALYPPVRARLPGPHQGRLEARSADHGAAKRAVGRVRRTARTS